MRKVLTLGLLGLLLLAVPGAALASIGVGVGTGKIEVKENLRSGGIYNLPPVTVFNTGSETANYTMAVTLNEKQPQLKPDPKWFSFSPEKFRLAPGKSRIVTPTLHLPLKTKPGNYFAYLEAHPAQTVKRGTTSVGVAAATKLSFDVVASNILFALFYRLSALYRQFEPWSQIITGLVILLAISYIINRFINLKAVITAALAVARQDRGK
jgi:hypothetical protein